MKIEGFDSASGKGQDGNILIIAILVMGLIGSFLFYLDYVGKQHSYRAKVYKSDVSDDTVVALGPQACAYVVFQNDYRNCDNPGDLVPIYDSKGSIQVPKSGGKFGEKVVRFRCVTPIVMDIETYEGGVWTKSGTLDCGSYFDPI